VVQCFEPRYVHYDWLIMMTLLCSTAFDRELRLMMVHISIINEIRPND